MQGKVEICGINTAKLKTLRSGEPEALLLRCRQGDKAAREQFIEGNLRLVLSVIQRFMGRGENPDDLFQVGCVGLLKAIRNFDPSKEVRFSTYGVPMKYESRNNVMYLLRLQHRCFAYLGLYHIFSTLSIRNCLSSYELVNAGKRRLII